MIICSGMRRHLCTHGYAGAVKLKKIKDVSTWSGVTTGALRAARACCHRTAGKVNDPLLNHGGSLLVNLNHHHECGMLHAVLSCLMCGNKLESCLISCVEQDICNKLGLPNHHWPGLPWEGGCINWQSKTHVLFGYTLL